MEAIDVANNTTTTVNTAAEGGGAENKKVEEGKFVEAQKKNRIQVSNTKKPLFFYLNLAKRCIKQHNNVVLSALGMAIPTVVTIAEILKANGLAMEKGVRTSTVGMKDEAKGRMIQKPKIEIVLEKNENAENWKDSTVTAPKKEADAKKASEISAKEPPLADTKKASEISAKEPSLADAKKESEISAKEPSLADAKKESEISAKEPFLADAKKESEISAKELVETI